MHARTIIAVPRHRRRGKTNRKRQARLAPPPAASHPGAFVCLLLSGCAGVVLTLSETCPVPVIEFGSTKQADSVRLDGIVQAS